MIWIILAVLALLGHVGQSLIAEFLHISRIHYILIIRWMMLICLLPATFYIPPPDIPLFYALTAVSGLIASWSDYSMFRSMYNNGAGVSTRLLSMVVFASFILWTLLNPSLFVDYANEPFRTLMLMSCMGATIFFTLRLRHCAISLTTLRDLWPVIACGAVITVMAKYAMDMTGPGGAFYYALMQTGVMVLVYTPLILRKKNSIKTCMNNGLFSICIALGAGMMTLLHIVAKNEAFRLVENPAYVLTLLLCAPFVISVYYRLVGMRDDSDLRAGSGIVISAIIFIWIAGV